MISSNFFSTILISTKPRKLPQVLFFLAQNRYPDAKSHSHFFFLRNTSGIKVFAKIFSIVDLPAPFSNKTNTVSAT
jgi:hypothetical protein